MLLDPSWVILIDWKQMCTFLTAVLVTFQKEAEHHSSNMQSDGIIHCNLGSEEMGAFMDSLHCNEAEELTSLRTKIQSLFC